MDALFPAFNRSLKDVKANKIVLALSGGMDSRVLLDLLHRYQNENSVSCLAVHVHHGLSANANHWVQQCQQWCADAGIELAVEYVELSLKGQSIEECAREARYQALAKHLGMGDVLLTGQHSDDQLETFLLALKRGSGPKGLSAMAKQMPFQGATLIRPLLDVAREQIEQYAQVKALEWVEDESNQDTRFDRNFIRHQVTPVLKQRWPHIHSAVQRTSELCAEQEALLEELLSSTLAVATYDDSSLSIEFLAQQSERVRTQLIRMWFAAAGLKMPSREHIAKIWLEVALARQDANPILNLNGGQVRRFSERLYWVSSVEDISRWQSRIQLNQSIDLPDNLGALKLVNSPQGKLSLLALQSAPLTIIFDPEGLSAHPLGRGHSRKLKKLFQEYGIPSWLRRRLPILICGDQVVAIANLFIDVHFSGQDCELIWDKPL
ncbi:tRNA lysidine(34) synthetase TilS [Vibrio sp. 404]|uniref:tRNA(Ile)-lysidine synthase n=1 Tax=Vibrio marinisediminis TaxID=2758441 RepID=A0A7W2FSB5_9VIBR|nr:tRNA lysidine(34) synthetase TilS [Vibrio marinisediminis]MBA5763368.1 tRNA lysidine(34) synthetase TilS [Vibrio marinisediminis]